GSTRIETRGSSGDRGSVRGTSAAAVDYIYPNGATRQISLQNDDGSTAVVTEASDFLGNLSTTTYSDGAVETRTFDPANRLAKVTDPDGVATLYAYDSRGRPSVTAIDMERNH